MMQTIIRNVFMQIEGRVKGSHKVWTFVLFILWLTTLIYAIALSQSYNWFVFGFCTGTFFTVSFTISYVNYLVNTGKIIKSSSESSTNQETS